MGDCLRDFLPVIEKCSVCGEYGDTEVDTFHKFTDGEPVCEWCLEAYKDFVRCSWCGIVFESSAKRPRCPECGTRKEDPDGKAQ
jgi:hypothetical protein